MNLLWYIMTIILLLIGPYRKQQYLSFKIIRYLLRICESHDSYRRYKNRQMHEPVAPNT